MYKTEKSELNFNYDEQNEKVRVNLDELINHSTVHDCVGKVSSIDMDSKIVYVDFKGNPFGSAIPAKLGRPFTLDDLERAIDHVLDIKLEFENHNLEKPIITDVFYSIIEDKKQKHQELQDIYIKGNRIVIDADTEVVIKSGNVTTTYCARDEKIVSKAKDIKLEALRKAEIRGSFLKLN